MWVWRPLEGLYYHSWTVRHRASLAQCKHVGEETIFVLWFQQALTRTQVGTGSPEKNSFFIFSKVVRHTDNHWRPLVQLVNAHAEQNAAVDGHNNVLQWGTLFCSQLASAHLYFWQTASKILFELPVMWLTCCQWTRWAESCFSSKPLSASDTCCCHQIQSERMLRLLT